MNTKHSESSGPRFAAHAFPIAKTGANLELVSDMADQEHGAVHERIPPAHLPCFATAEIVRLVGLKLFLPVFSVFCRRTQNAGIPAVAGMPKCRHSSCSVCYFLPKMPAFQQRPVFQLPMPGIFGVLHPW